MSDFTHCIWVFSSLVHCWLGQWVLAQTPVNMFSQSTTKSLMSHGPWEPQQLIHWFRAINKPSSHHGWVNDLWFTCHLQPAVLMSESQPSVASVLVPAEFQPFVRGLNRHSQQTFYLLYLGNATPIIVITDVWMNHCCFVGSPNCSISPCKVENQSWRCCPTAS